MYIFNNFELYIIFNRYLLFKDQLIFYLTGKLDENEFKIIRLQNGIYRQKLSYMCRILLPYGKFLINQIYLISYILFKFDKYYLHCTTRLNIQINWFKLFNSIDIFFFFIFVGLCAIQTSGNCVRNITVNYNYSEINFIKNEVWCEIFKQWAFLNSRMLFLPRKFKISISFYKFDNSYIKIHDLGIFVKKNSINNLLFDILVGGGLGRTPIKSILLIKNLHWKNIINYCNIILKIYNIDGYRDNLYKSRIKILIKSISIENFFYRIKNEFLYINNLLYILNEREINALIYNFYNNCLVFNFLNYNKILIKKLYYNIFFSDWLISDKKFTKIYNINLNLILKWFNTPPGDINYIQLKLLFYIFFLINCDYCFINNRQNINFNFKKKYLYNLYKIFKNYFFLIYTKDCVFNIVTCPGKDFCSLANSESIFLSIFIQKYFVDYNTLNNLNLINLNISGCINSCAHHHISNLGFIGVNKKNKSYYQICLGGDNTFNNLNFSNILGPSIQPEYILIKFIEILKTLLLIKNNHKYFIEIYNKCGYLFFKNLYL